MSILDKIKKGLGAKSPQGARTAGVPIQKIPAEHYQFADFPEVQRFNTETWYMEKQGFPQITFLKRMAVSDAVVNLEGREIINYSTYNYLGLAGDVRVTQAAKDAIDQWGTSTGSGRSITGEIDIHQDFERELCDVLGTEEAVLSVGGYSTNAFAVGYLFRPKDVIFYDELIHNSALSGCQLSGARRYSFPHNDYEALEKLIQQHRGQHERAVILAEGVYSMDGDIPDIPRLIELKNKYKTLLMVDEAHSFGIIGPNGLGVTDYFDINGKDIDIHFGSLSKAFATCGGYVAGSKPMIDILKHYAPGVLLYGASPTPANTAAGLEALRIMKAEPERAKRLRDNAAYFIKKANEVGLDTYNSKDSGVVPVMVPDSEKAIWLTCTLFDKGICAYPMMYPIVPRDKSRLRFFMNTNHTQEQIDYTVNTIVESLKLAPKSKGII